MRKFLRSLFVRKAAKAPVFVGYSASDGIGLWDEHPSFKGEFVRTSLDVYADKVGDRNEPLETVATDFLADLFHLLTSEGEDPEQIISSALMHFEAENDAEPVFA